MAIPTSTDAWENSEKGEALRDNILEFLQDHSDQAYQTRELADEIMNTGWAVGREEERLRQEVGEDEFQENQEEYEAELSEDRGFTETLMDQIQTARLRTRLGDLTEEGLVEGRKVPIEHTDIPYDWDTALYHTYAGSTE